MPNEKKKQNNKDELMIKKLVEKSVIKRDVFKITNRVFSDLKSAPVKIYSDLNSSIKIGGKQLPVEYFEQGQHEAELRVPGDSIIFIRHTDVFTFHRSHNIWKSSYVQENESRSYCGMIYIYNFLSESMKKTTLNFYILFPEYSVS